MLGGIQMIALTSRGAFAQQFSENLGKTVIHFL
jgi:hypothetical protein